MTLTDLLARAVETAVASRTGREAPHAPTPRAGAVARIATIAVATPPTPEATQPKEASRADAYVTLRGGLTVPVAALALLLDWERRGLGIRRTGDDQVSVQPVAALTASDLAGLTRWRAHLLALIDYVPPVM